MAKKIARKPRKPTIRDMLILSKNPDEAIRTFENRYYYLAYTLRYTKNIAGKNCSRKIKEALESLIKIIIEDKTKDVDQSMIYNILLFTKLYLKEGIYVNNPEQELSYKEINNLLTNIKEKSLNHEDLPLKTLKLM